MGNALSRALQCSFVAAIACCCAGPSAAAQPAEVKDAWVRAPAPGQQVAGAYMEITASTALWLTAAASPVAARAELHSTTMDGGVMKMRAIEKLELPRGKAVKLAPGGLHIMLVNLKQALRPGDTVPITLTVLREDSGSRDLFTVQAQVREMAAAQEHQH